MLKKIETNVLMYICAQEDFIINFYCICAQEDNSTRLHLGVPLLGVNTDIKKERKMHSSVYGDSAIPNRLAVFG